MAYRKQAPRLNRHEIRELGRIAASLMTVHESLQHTNWAGAAPSAAIVGQAVDALVAIYRRTRVFLPEYLAELAAAAAEASQQSDGQAGALEDGASVEPAAVEN